MASFSTHEVVWKTLDIPLNGTVQGLGLHTVKLSEVVVEHDPEATEQKDAPLNLKLKEVSFIPAGPGTILLERQGLRPWLGHPAQAPPTGRMPVPQT